jgi:hypothetical protein
METGGSGTGVAGEGYYLARHDVSAFLNQRSGEVAIGDVEGAVTEERKALLANQVMSVTQVDYRHHTSSCLARNPDGILMD